MLAIVASMEQELSRLRAELASRGASRMASGQPELHVIGIGKTNTRNNVDALLSRHYASQTGEPIQGLLFLGFAGALDPALRTGDLVLAPRFHQANATPTGQRADSEDGTGRKQQLAQARAADGKMFDLGLKAASEAGLEVSPTDSLTVDRLISTSAEKLELARHYPVASVNMEDYWVAEAAAEAGVPFLAARVVLDLAGQDLPAYLPTLARSRRTAAIGAVIRPWRIPRLLGVADQMRQCQRVLARFAVSYMGVSEQWSVTSRQPLATDH